MIDDGYFANTFKISFVIFLFGWQIEREGENKVSVQDVLLELRRFRMGLIQTVDQLLFSYQAIIEGIKRLNNPVSLLSRYFFLVFG